MDAAWLTVAAAIGVPILSGFIYWMARIDRGHVRIESKVDGITTSLTAHIEDDERKHTELYDDRNAHSQRLTRLETCNEMQNQRRHRESPGGAHAPA